MDSVRDQVDALAGMMKEYGLSEARLEQDGVTVAFRRTPTPSLVPQVAVEGAPAAVTGFEAEPEEEEEVAPVVEAGTPVKSPMSGIFYRSPSPSAPAFVKEGETIAAGDIIGLIEAMKVFNEIPSPVSGVVLKLSMESGQLVQPGDTLVVVG